MQQSTITKTHSAREVKKRLNARQAELHNLIDIGKVHAARRLASKTAKKAADLGYYRVACSCYEFLMEFYELWEPSKYHHDKFEKKYKVCDLLLREEHYVRAAYRDIARNMDRKRAMSKRTIAAALEHLEMVEKFEAKGLHGGYFYHKYFMFKCIVAHIQGHYEGEYKIAQKAYRYFEGEFLNFAISKFYFMTVQAVAMSSMGRWDAAEGLICKARGIQITKMSAWNRNVLTAARIAINQDRDATALLQEYIELGADNNHLHDLLYLYNEINQGRPVADTSHLNVYQRDTTGLGISFNVAKLWNAKLKGNLPDYKQRIDQFCNDHLGNDARSKGYLRRMIGKKDVNLSTDAWHPDIEIIPFEQVIEKYERIK